MININQKQAIKRYDTLPQSLKDAVWSPYLNDIVRRRVAGLGDYTILIVGTLVGDVLMGFSLADDFEKNLKEAVDIDPKKATEISEEINKKIFLPLKAEIENNYNPVVAEETEESQSTPLEAAAREVSGIQPLKIETGTPAEAQPATPAPAQAAAKQPAPAGQPSLTETPEPAPVPLEPIVMREEKVSPLQRSVNLGDFQIELPQTRKPVASAVAAEFELGNFPASPASKTPPKPAAQKPEIPKVVHYSAYKTNLSDAANKPNQPAVASGTTEGQPANKNAFSKLQEGSAAVTAHSMITPSMPLPPEKTKGEQRESAIKFVNLNNLGVTTEPAAPAKNPPEKSGPEIKGNTVDLSRKQ
ncbi:MAG: hypothetical protein M1334_03440 [Patescibacteria group bacterium]|nr:hypothetical protein [Patescibacteria group bacterium]